MKASRMILCALTIFMAERHIAIGQEMSREDWVPPSGTQIEELNGTLPAAAEDLTPPPRVLFVTLGLIKNFEGWSAHPYDDPADYCTIGWGHLIKKAPCNTITNLKLGEFAPPPLDHVRGNALLAKDTVPARRAVKRLVVAELTPRQFGALTSFVYNVGVGNFSRSTMLKMLNQGRFDLAMGEFQRWNRAGGKVYRGLARRRACEFELFNGRGRLLENGIFDDRICEINVAAAESIANPIDIEVGETGP